MRRLQIFLLFVLSLGVAGHAVDAQGFQVRPLFVEGDVPPGTNVVIPIEITPTSQIEGRTLQVDVVQLAQAEAGGFRAIAFEPGTELPRSLAPWIEVPPQIDIAARDTTTLEVNMQVPFDARGSYAAGLLLSAPPPEDAEGLRLTLRVLIPIILGAEGRPARQDVRLADAQLAYRLSAAAGSAVAPDPDRLPETTLVRALVENRGGTFSRFRGDLWVDVKDDSGEWRQIRRVGISEMRILPEAAISLPVDLGRLLPSGDYRIRGELYVDGRRTAPLRREIAFDGHPQVQTLATDIDLGLDPDIFRYDFQPGATRTGRISVTNPAIDPIEVQIGVALPADMAGRASAAVRDTDLSAADWIEVTPAQFMLRPGQTRNLRLLARFPAADLEHQNKYAELDLSAYYLDGQRAGSATGLVEVRRPGGEDMPELELETLRLVRTETDGIYALALRAANIGNVLVRPRFSYRVLDADETTVAQGNLESDATRPLMPLAARSFGAILNAAPLPDGAMTLLAVVRNGEAGALLGEIVQPLHKDEEGNLVFEP